MADLGDIKKMKVAELRDELKTRGLDTKGVKADLVKRLEESFNADDEAEESSVGEAEEAEEALEAEQDAEAVQDEDKEDSDDVPAEVAQPESVTQVDDDDLAAVADEPVAEAEPVTEAEPITETEPDAGLVAEGELVAEDEPVITASEEPMVVESDTVQSDAAEQQQTAKPAAAGDSDEPVVVLGEDSDDAMDTGKQTSAAKDEEQNGDAADAVIIEGDDGEEFQVMDAVGGDGDDKSEKRSDRRRRSHSHERKRSYRDRSRSRSRSPRRHRSHSGDRRHRHRSPSPEPKESIEPENEDWLAVTDPVLDRYNCDLHVTIDEAGFKATPITSEGFAFMWGGVRSNYGVSTGKVAFEMKVSQDLSVDHLPPDELNKHVVRVGWSADSCSTRLGEEPLSYGYGGTGKASTNCVFKDYGQTFGAGDVITAYVDFENDPVVLSFSKNGEDLGMCYEVPAEELAGNALYPHIFTKNCEVLVNFGQQEEPWFAIKEDFTWLNGVAEESRVRATLPPVNKGDCEMLMMCGLPACGKTTWAEKHSKEHPEKRYSMLGTNNIIDLMKVNGLPRKKNYSGRWDVLIQKASKCLNRLLEIAASKKRNYILDQTNVYPSAQRRKMRPFEGFQRTAIVIVPSDDDLKSRTAEREKVEGKDVPDHAVNEMKANFKLPEVGSSFEKVEYIEIGSDDVEAAKKIVEKYNADGKAALPPPDKRSRMPDSRPISRFSGRDYRENRGRYDNRDQYGRGGYRDRGYGDRRGGSGGDYRRGSSNYMGYSQGDRQRMDSRNRYDNRGPSGNRNGGSGGYNRNWGQGGWGGHGQGGWGQGGWGGQGQGGWGQQGGWGGQYQGNWGGQWGGYGQGHHQQGWGGYGQGQQQQQGWGGYGGQGSGYYGGGGGGYNNYGGYQK